MLVSIIVNNHNYGRFLAAAIDSALDQRYSDVEVIVVDDGSSDDSREIIAGYGSRIVAVYKENGGQASAMNAGFGRACGSVVIFLDADDMLLPDTASRVAESFVASPYLAKLMYPLAVINGEGTPTGDVRPYAHLRMRSGNLRHHVLTFPFDMTWVATSGNAFAARVLETIMPIPEKEYPILADYYLSLLAPLSGLVAVLPKVGGYYRVHGANNHERGCPEIDLGQIRQTLAYSETTCRYIRQYAQELKLVERPPSADRLLSVSLISQRLISLKLDPAGHPFLDDTPWRLFRLGVKASLQRFDVTWAMRFTYLLWFALLLLSGPRAARWLTTSFMRPEKRGSFNALLGVMHRSNVLRR